MSWSTKKHRVEFQSDGWSLGICPDRLSSGWELQKDGQSCLPAFFGMQCSTELAAAEDFHLPSNHLIIEYPHPSKTSLALQATITHVDPLRITVELTIAVSTREFESYPQLAINVPQFESSTLQSINPWNHAPYHGGLLILPNDVVQGRLGDQQSDQRNQLLLFGSFFERGVIRKIRLRLVVAHDDCAINLQSELDNLENSPLPLLA